MCFLLKLDDNIQVFQTPLSLSYIMIGHTPTPHPVIMCHILAYPRTPNLYDVINEQSLIEIT